MDMSISTLRISMSICRGNHCIRFLCAFILVFVYVVILYLVPHEEYPQVFDPPCQSTPAMDLDCSSCKQKINDCVIAQILNYFYANPPLNKGHENDPKMCL